MRLIFALWTSRWGLLRLGLALGLCAVLVMDEPARLARLQYAALPGYDYARQADELARQQRYGEALLVVDAGLGDCEDATERRALLTQRERIADSRDSVLRKAGEFARGAAVGDGESLESLIGAVSADLLIVGDVRDLLIQGARLAFDGETDEVILALSGLGLGATVIPAIDVSAGLLKAARKAGAVTEHMGAALVDACRAARRDGGASARRILNDVACISEAATPAGAVRLLRRIDDPQTLARVADYLRKNPAGAFALHVTGGDGIRLLRQDAKLAEATLDAAARKGAHGVAWLRTGRAGLLRPHPLIGLAKSWWKGTAPRLMQRASREFLDPAGWWLLPAVGFWAAMELWRILRRLSPSSRSRREQHQIPQPLGGVRVAAGARP